VIEDPGRMRNMNYHAISRIWANCWRGIEMKKLIFWFGVISILAAGGDCIGSDASVITSASAALDRWEAGISPEDWVRPGVDPLKMLGLVR
jgi:hypothetical protein